MEKTQIENPAPETAPETETPVAAGEPPPGVDAIAEQLGLESKPEAGESEDARFRALVEAVVYITDEPLSAQQIAAALGQPVARVEQVLAGLVADYGQPHRGLAIREVAGGYKMSTKPEFHDEIRAFVKKLKPPLKLSLAALETLAVIAYKQPVTAPEILEIRGVQGAGVLKTLLERRLITAAGRKQVVGRPVLYKTTKDFLVQFGLKDLTELPTLKEFEEWSRLALGESDPGESLAEPAAAQSPAEPTAETEAEPSAESVAQSAAGAPAEPTAETAAKPYAESVARSGASALAEPTAETAAKPSAESVAQSAAGAPAEPAAQPPAEPSAGAPPEPAPHQPSSALAPADAGPTSDK